MPQKKNDFSRIVHLDDDFKTFSEREKGSLIGKESEEPRSISSHARVEENLLYYIYISQ